MFADALMADRAMHGNNKNNNKNQKQHTKNKNNNKNSNHKHATKKLAVRVEHALQQQEKKSNYNKPWWDSIKVISEKKQKPLQRQKNAQEMQQALK